MRSVELIAWTSTETPETVSNSVSHYFDSRVGTIREHILALIAAVPDLPKQFGRAVALVSADLGDRGRIEVLLLLAVFVGLGFGVEWLFRKATQKTRHRLDGLPMETVDARLRLVAARLAFAFGAVVAFALGSLGPSEPVEVLEGAQIGILHHVLGVVFVPRQIARQRVGGVQVR